MLLEYEVFEKDIYGRFVGDKEYISKKFLNFFCGRNTTDNKVKNPMKRTMMSVSDKILLRKRAIIETINNKLKTSL